MNPDFVYVLVNEHREHPDAFSFWPFYDLIEIQEPIPRVVYSWPILRVKIKETPKIRLSKV